MLGCASLNSTYGQFTSALHLPDIFFHRSSFCRGTKSFTNRFASSSQFNFASGDASLNCFRVSGEGRNAKGFFCSFRFIVLSSAVCSIVALLLQLIILDLREERLIAHLQHLGGAGLVAAGLLEHLPDAERFCDVLSVGIPSWSVLVRRGEKNRPRCLFRLLDLRAAALELSAAVPEAVGPAERN